MNIEELEEALMPEKEAEESKYFTVLKEEYTIGPWWKCSECDHEGIDFITVVYSNIYYGNEYDMECPQCGGNQIDEM